MKSKKGFIITAGVLAAITVASFAVWFIPQNNQSSIVISNPSDELDALIDQQKAISESDKIEFDKMLSGQITPENYIAIAEISSGQIRSIIISITEPDVPEQWMQSYSALADSLRAYNTYLRETTVIAEKLKSDPASDITEDKAKLEQYLTQAQDSLAASNDSRPA
ncbi:hypothetical protein [Candidatus Nitrosotenuis aquarius]|uniref:hypothetical protein n=1 Tax=Candidatus Nitrosotenuis aquarius TaxID=1846278 RepID=UPI000C1E2A60|nr:hypothetical protein [Candidatus Nitrosotenuis aquarius]